MSSPWSTTGKETIEFSGKSEKNQFSLLNFLSERKESWPSPNITKFRSPLQLPARLKFCRRRRTTTAARARPHPGATERRRRPPWTAAPGVVGSPTSLPLSVGPVGPSPQTARPLARRLSAGRRLSAARRPTAVRLRHGGPLSPAPARGLAHCPPRRRPSTSRRSAAASARRAPGTRPAAVDGNLAVAPLADDDDLGPLPLPAVAAPPTGRCRPRRWSTARGPPVERPPPSRLPVGGAGPPVDRPPPSRPLVDDVVSLLHDMIHRRWCCWSSFKFRRRS